MSEHPTLTITAWNATPEQAEAIFEAAMEAAVTRAGDVTVDGVATLNPTREDA